jgi:DNA polymerase III subunit gamma/tau
MSYEVFALKYRPKTFHDVVGQTAVAATLKRAVTSERVANSFLFCGSRGTGKTSMARILAKALNCPNASDGEPCNACDICKSVAAGGDLDVIEIDGASNRGIDDIRNVRDSAGFVPARSRYKVYIIDEVHMLTIQAFNALLKVLEEPPPHVKFIFATTDPTSLPDTILSRCQRHEFKRIGPDDIVGRLRHICDLEGVAAEDDALRAIAMKAEGGLRDSVSLLDQVVSYAGAQVGVQDLAGALGLLPREHLARVVTAIAAGDGREVVLALRDTAEAGLDPQELLDEVIAALHELMVWHVSAELVKGSRYLELFESLGAGFPLDRVQFVLKMLLAAKGEIRRSGHERIQIELACLKAARSRDFLPLDDILERLRSGVTSSEPLGSAAAPPAPAAAPPAFAREAAPPPAHAAPPRPPAAASQASRPSATPAATVRTAAPSEPPAASAAAAVAMSLRDLTALWPRVVAWVRQSSAALGSQLADAKPALLEGRRLTLEVPAAKKFHLQALAGREAQQLIGEALREVAGVALSLTVVAGAGGAAAKPVDGQSVYEDPTVRKLIEHFDGGVINVERNDGEGV